MYLSEYHTKFGIYLNIFLINQNCQLMEYQYQQSKISCYHLIQQNMEVSNQQLFKNSKKYSEQTLSKNKKSAIENDEEDYSMLSDILKIIENMYEMRFVEKVSRPIETRVKQEYVEKFAGKMESLHAKLEKVKIQLLEKTKHDGKNYNRNRSIIGSVTNKPIDWKKSIRQIQNRYVEVFVEGSFKHYPRLCQQNKFAYPLKIIQISEWSASCQQSNNQIKDVCCC